MRDGDHGAPAPAAIAGEARRGLALARPALAPVRAACRLCGFSVRGFLSGTTCVLRVDGRALQSACRHAATACGEEQACAGLREAVRAARRS